jgi:hypothetical protein
VVQRGRFSLYVFDEAKTPHHLPHCHVRWSGGSASVSLRGLVVLGGNLPPAARELLEEHYDQLRDTWNRLNPGRPME